METAKCIFGKRNGGYLTDNNQECWRWLFSCDIVGGALIQCRLSGSKNTSSGSNASGLSALWTVRSHKYVWILCYFHHCIWKVRSVFSTFLQGHIALQPFVHRNVTIWCPDANCKHMERWRVFFTSQHCSASNSFSRGKRRYRESVHVIELCAQRVCKGGIYQKTFCVRLVCKTYGDLCKNLLDSLKYSDE